MKMKALASAVALAAGSMASAEVVTVTASTSGLTDFFSQANLPQFDPSLGTLQSVKFTAVATVAGEFNFRNVSGGNKRYRITYIDWDVKATAFGGPLGNVVSFDWATPPSPDFPFGTAPGHFNTGLSASIPVGSSIAPLTYGGSYSGGGTYFDGDAEFASFIGSSTVPVSIAIPVLFSVGVSGSGQSLWTLATTGSLEVTAEYTYVVPAPAAAGFLCLAGVGTMARRRRA